MCRLGLVFGGGAAHAPHMRSRVLSAVVVAGLGLGGVALPTASASPRQHWLHHADLDGDGTPDPVRIVAGDDLDVGGVGGTGHYVMHVTLSSSGDHVSKRLYADHYFSGSRDWTPWWGRTQLDQRAGKELLVGYTSGAHTAVF